MLHILSISFSFVLFLTMFCGVLACFSVPARSGMFPLSRKFCRGLVQSSFSTYHSCEIFNVNKKVQIFV